MFLSHVTIFPSGSVTLVSIEGRTQGGWVGVNPPPLELDILQKLITCAKEINCFRMLLLVNLST